MIIKFQKIKPYHIKHVWYAMLNLVSERVITWKLTVSIFCSTISWLEQASLK